MADKGEDEDGEGYMGDDAAVDSDAGVIDSQSASHRAAIIAGLPEEARNCMLMVREWQISLIAHYVIA